MGGATVQEPPPPPDEPAPPAGDAFRAFSGGGLGRLREHNRAAVLRALLDAGPRGRHQLARQVGLTQPALSYIAAELLAAGLVEEAPAGPAAGAVPARGRRVVPLDLAPDGRYAVAVHAGATGLEVGLVGLRAGVAHRRTSRIDHRRWGPRPEAFAAAVAGQVRDLVAAAGVPERALLGVGIGVAGWVDGARGIVRSHAQLGWRDVPLGRLLAEALALPVAVEDHVRAMGLAEAWFGVAREQEAFVLLYVGAVVGCAVVFGRRVHRGHAAAAGSIGRLPPRRRRVPAGRGAGAPGAPPADLEGAVSEPALYRRAGRSPRRRVEPALLEWTAGAGSTVPPSSALAELVGGPGGRAANPVAYALLEQRAADLAPAVAGLIATYDPAQLVVAGPIGWDGRGLQLALLRRAVAAAAPGLAGRLPAFVPSAFGPGGALVGAGALILRELYSPPLGDAAGPGVARSDAVRGRSMKEDPPPRSDPGGAGHG